MPCSKELGSQSLTAIYFSTTSTTSWTSKNSFHSISVISYYAFQHITCCHHVSLRASPPIHRSCRSSRRRSYPMGRSFNRKFWSLSDIAKSLNWMLIMKGTVGTTSNVSLVEWYVWSNNSTPFFRTLWEVEMYSLELRYLSEWSNLESIPTESI